MGRRTIALLFAAAVVVGGCGNGAHAPGPARAEHAVRSHLERDRLHALAIFCDQGVPDGATTTCMVDLPHTCRIWAVKRRRRGELAVGAGRGTCTHLESGDGGSAVAPTVAGAQSAAVRSCLLAAGVTTERTRDRFAPGSRGNLVAHFDAVDVRIAFASSSSEAQRLALDVRHLLTWLPARDVVTRGNVMFYPAEGLKLTQGAEQAVVACVDSES